MNKMADQLSEVDNVANNLAEIQEDVTVPRNVRTKIEFIVNTLKEGIELSIKVNKALNELDEIVNDINLQPYTRTQLWNVMSALEKLNHAK